MSPWLRVKSWLLVVGWAALFAATPSLLSMLNPLVAFGVFLVLFALSATTVRHVNQLLEI